MGVGPVLPDPRIMQFLVWGKPHTSQSSVSGRLRIAHPFSAAVPISLRLLGEKAQIHTVIFPIIPCEDGQNVLHGLEGKEDEINGRTNDSLTHTTPQVAEF